MQLPNRSERVASMLAGSIALAGLIAEKQFFALPNHGIFKAVGFLFAAVIYGAMRGRFAKVDRALIEIKASPSELQTFRFYERATYLHVCAFISVVGYLVFAQVGAIISTITVAVVIGLTIALYRKAAECELIALKYDALSA